jgi:hypothetical protein
LKEFILKLSPPARFRFRKPFASFTDLCRRSFATLSLSSGMQSSKTISGFQPFLGCETFKIQLFLRHTKLFSTHKIERLSQKSPVKDRGGFIFI